jgi:hypothetical protein
MKNFITVIFLIALAGILSTTYGQWQKDTIDYNLPQPTVVYAGDIDSDTDLDLAVTSWISGDVVWYENNLPNPDWLEHTIDGNLFDVIGVYVADIDGDDTLDVIAAGSGVDDVVWYENGGGVPITWTKWTIDANLDGAIWVYAADIDGDTDLDVVATGEFAGDVVWYENGGGVPITWTKWTIDADLAGATVVSVGDIDGDDALDVVTAGVLADAVVWYENILPNPNWPKHTIDADLNAAIGVSIGDIDGDNNLDVAAVGYVANDVVWYENILPDTTWPKHTIDDNLNNTRMVEIVDINGDPFLDVVATSMTDNDVVWYKNNLPDTIWTKDTIDANLGGARVFTTADIDDDNDTDVIALGQSANDVVWYENLIITAPILIEPENNVTLISDTVIFVWQKNQPEVEKYWLELDITDQFSAPVFSDSTITDTTLLYTSLINGEYWWRVKAGNLSDWGEFSEVRTFNVNIVSVEEDNQLPTEFSLKQNYPNPLNPSTKIKYSIPDLSFVTLKVYDVLGSEVATLVNEEKPVGTYEITWTVDNLPSGIYFYRLQAGSFVETKKMVLMK